MKRIAMVVWNEFLNDARVLKEAETLQRSGYQVCVFALHTPGVTKANERLADGIEVIRIARSPFWKWRKSVRNKASTEGPSNHKRKISVKHQVLRIITRAWTHLCLMVQMLRYKADVVHAHDVNTLPTAWLAAKLGKSHLVYDAHEISTSREGYNSFRRLVALIEKWLMPKADGTITTTDARAKFFARAYQVKRPTVLQNRPRFIASEATNRIRDELDLDQPWPIILYQGGLQQGRGLEKLIQAASLVPNAYFVFIGGGRLTQALIQLSRDSGLQDRIYFIPTVSLADLPSYTASADIGVQPIENTCLNHYTTDSNKLFEYLTAGLPVVATNFPEIRKIVQRNEVGLLIPHSDPVALAAALNELVSDSALRSKFASNARITAHRLNWEEQEARLVQLYECVVRAQTK
ncbi:MAG: glycosyltransferase family 4 protein [Candidatus Pseudomonas phytovorans]|uniref:Glycosyltransferase family 4 protein n=1 Tax=Candidatus Pseudomonas phytovorans TaxID=3121377 RepID=A0AAJ5WFC4_9PSED|nr:glycosyltransferase family 4 protein [Pseudomonas sp.]WEK29770.1 MAG: glycosyltransferase family 4 protein [Pseudomonas sp.]